MHAERIGDTIRLVMPVDEAVELRSSLANASNGKWFDVRSLIQAWSELWRITK